MQNAVLHVAPGSPRALAGTAPGCSTCSRRPGSRRSTSCSSPRWSGAVVPRTFRLVGSARTPPPGAPRNLRRLPQLASWAIRRRCRRTRRRRRRPPSVLGGPAVPGRGARRRGTPTTGWRPRRGTCARLRQLCSSTPSLLGVLARIAPGGLFGYKRPTSLVVEGQTFSDSTAQLAEFHPGLAGQRVRSGAFLAHAGQVHGRALTRARRTRQASTINANVSYWTRRRAAKTYDIQVNHPPSVDSVKVYLIGYRYAPQFTVWPQRRRLPGGDPVHPGQHQHDAFRRRGKGAERLARLRGRVRADRLHGERDESLESIFPGRQQPGSVADHTRATSA